MRATLLFVLLAACILTSCAAPRLASIPIVFSDKKREFYSVDRNQIGGLMSTNGITGFLGGLFADVKYTLVDEDWIKEEFIPSFSFFVKTFGLNTYYLERNDCDDIARTAAFWCNYFFLKNNPKYKNSVAMGELWYVRDAPDKTKTGHAINFFVVYDRKEKCIRPVFFDPQSKMIVNLSDAERKSVICWRYIMLNHIFMKRKAGSQFLNSCFVIYNGSEYRINFLTVSEAEKSKGTRSAIFWDDDPWRENL